jgi:hypothetical protein
MESDQTKGDIQVVGPNLGWHSGQKYLSTFRVSRSFLNPAQAKWNHCLQPLQEIQSMSLSSEPVVAFKWQIAHMVSSRLARGGWMGCDICVGLC